MGSLHNVTQLHKFVLSGDGAFLPILAAAEPEFAEVFERQKSKHHGLSRVPADVQDVDGHLDIHGMNTTSRRQDVAAQGKFLHIQPGGKHGYGSELSELIEVSLPFLGDFWFFVFWNNQCANEYSKSNGSTSILETQKVKTNEYSDFILDKLRGDPVVAHRYLVECGLWAKRFHEAELAEYGKDAISLVDEFPDAIKTLKQALKLVPDAPEAIAAIDWYERNSNKSDG